MGAYDDLLADVPAKAGAYDDLLTDADKPEPSLKSKIYKAANKFFQPASVIDAEFTDIPKQTGFDNTGAVNRVLDDARPVNNLKAGAKIVDGLTGIAEVGGRKGYAGLGRIEAGAIKALADVLGSDTLSNVAKNQQDYASQVEHGAVLRGKPIEGFSNESIVQDLPDAATNAISSVIQTAPTLAAGAIAPEIIYPAMFASTTAQEYGSGREAGLTPTGAAIRAPIQGAFEVLGEKLGGMDKIASAMHAARSGNGASDLASALLASSIKEVPSEEVTTTGQFLADKLPGVGTNQEAGLDDYGKAVKDTALATLLQSGAMAGGGHVLNSIANKTQAEPVINADVQESTEPNQFDATATIDALNQAKELIKPRVEVSNGTEADDALAEQKQAEFDATNAATPAYDDLLADIDKGATNDQSITNADVGNRTAESQPDNGNGSAGAELLAQPAEPSDAEENTQGGSGDISIPMADKPNRTLTVKPKSNTLLTALRDLGGVSINDKLDVTGERKSFAPGGYNQVFKKNARQSLKGHIESGGLDDYLPPAMRLTAGINDNQAYDSTEAYDYISERIRNGERVIPYDTEQEINASKYYQDDGVDAQHDINEADEILDEGEINEQLRIAGNTEREANAQAKQFVTRSEDGNTESSFGSQARESNQPTSISTQTSEREGVRPLLESLVKRRSAANELGKTKPFDAALQLAKDFMAGNDVKPAKFKNAASLFKNDKVLSDAFNSLYDLAKAPAKAIKAETNYVIDNYKSIIANAKTVDELQALAGKIQQDTNLSDAQAQALDDLVFDAQDAIETPERRAEGAGRVERRTETETRKTVNQMSADEMRRALLIDDLTGLGNRRAYDESVKKQSQVSIDADGLKWINDNLGHESGDILLAAIGEAIGRITTDSYHISGDEFVVQANNDEVAADIMDAVNELLAEATIEGVNSNGDKVTLKGIGISYGIAKDLKDAENKLQQHKSERETAGLRAGRGEQPANAIITSQRSKNNQDNTSSQDLLGQDTSKQQAVADAERAKDAKRNTGADNQDTFTLTGSDSEADKAAAAGAQDLFADSGNMVDKPLFSRSEKSSSPKEIIDGAKKYFGTTLNPKEAGYILPDGTMLDFSGKHQADKSNWPYMRGERATDHREFFGENLHNGSTLKDLIQSNDGNEAMREFMSKTGAMRVDFSAGVASIMAKPTPEQIKLFGNGNKGQEVSMTYVDGASGRIVDEIEINSASAMNVGKFYEGAVKKPVDSSAPLFSRGESTGGMAKEEVSLVVDRLRANWENAPKIVVVDDMNDPAIREAVRAENDRQLSQGAQGQPEGFFDADKVYVVASEMGNADDVHRVVFHETLGHFGLQGTFGNALNDVLDKLYELRRADVLKKAKQYGLDFTNQKDRRIAAEEVLAEMAQNNPQIGFVKRAIAAIRQWLRDNGFSLKLSDNDIIANYLLPAREYVQRGKKQESTNGMVPAFSRSEDANKPVTVDSRDNWLFRRDELGNIQLAPTGKAYDFIANITQNIADKANFGMASPELRKQIRHFKADMQKALDVAENVAHGMQKMTPENRALVSDVVENMLKSGTVPPQHVLDVAANMQSIMDTQTDELVKLGMLNKDAAERWRGKYLPRFYNREQDPALSTLGQKLLRTALPVRGMGGGSLKGRGLYKEISVRELPDWEALGWEVRDTLWKKNQQGKLELNDPNKVRETDNVVIWRDYTPKERETMGENRDAMFRFVMGYTAMQNDIALGRLFDGIASNQTWTRARPSEGYTKVPDSEIAETGGVKKYGNLAGLYVRDDIMQHITQYEESGDLLKYYRKALSIWKAGKTVLNPVSHMNNMVSNLTMAHFAGVSYWDTHKYVNAVKDFVNNAPMIKEAKDVGLMTGDITRAELIADMPADIKAMMNQKDSNITKSAKATYNLLTFGLTKPMSKAYRFEDDFFKYLIYKEARAKGVSPDDAVDYATKYIFNYDDLPKTARLIRDAAIPFFAYTYKAAPALAHTAFNYPWRFAAPAAAIGGLNALAYGLMAGDDDDDLAERYAKGKELEAEERKNLPPWMQGKSALGTEKTVRLGTDEKTGLPIYMDVSRFIPGGDMFDIAHGDYTTLPAPITPSNPILTTIAALMPQINKDTFTGKDVIDKNDTPAEAAKKRASWLIKQISPAIAPTGYHAEKLLNAGAQMADTTINIPFVGFGDDVEYTGFGKDGLPVQPKYAAMNTLGVKARPTDLELSAEISQGQDNSEIKSIKLEIKQSARLLDKGAISQRAYDKVEAEAMKKIDNIVNKQ
jgi:GGDEF domain-containing protein/uncharacterized protein YidB (DUF937 family)